LEFNVPFSAQMWLYQRREEKQTKFRVVLQTAVSACSLKEQSSIILTFVLNLATGVTSLR